MHADYDPGYDDLNDLMSHVGSAGGVDLVDVEDAARQLGLSGF